jgi:L-gulonolactone oxidase
LKPKDLEVLYPEFNNFKDVMNRVDPGGVMRSEYVRRHIEGEDIPRRVFKERS